MPQVDLASLPVPLLTDQEIESSVHRALQHPTVWAFPVEQQIAVSQAAELAVRSALDQVRSLLETHAVSDEDEADDGDSTEVEDDLEAATKQVVDLKAAEAKRLARRRARR